MFPPGPSNYAFLLISSIASGLSQRCVKSLLTILIRLQHIQRKQQEGVSAQHQLSESGNRYAQSDDDEVFTAQPVFEGEDVVLGTLGNSLPYDTPQP
jgi:hypothetical protein